MSESELLRSILLALPSVGARGFRNNVGVLEWAPGKRLRYGLCNGSSDIIGWHRGRFMAIEVKTATGRVKSDQQHFIDQVNAAGGIGIIARSVNEVLEALRG